MKSREAALPGAPSEPVADRGREATVGLRALPMLIWGCLLLLAVSLWTLSAEDELSLGRRPWENLRKTAAEMAQPSFLELWFGDEKHEARDAEGNVLRVTDERAAESSFLKGVGRALWTTLRIATVGTGLATLLALPLGLLAARNLGARRPVF